MRAPHRSIVALSAVAFFVMMGVSIVSPVLPDYAFSFGVSFTLAGLLVSGFGIARLLLDLPAGMLAERVGTRRFMLIGLGIIAASSLIAGLAPSYSVLLTARIFEGIGSAIYSTTSLTAVSRTAPPESRGASLSLYMSMFLVGTVIGPVVGGFAAENFGLGAPFTVYGLCATFSAVLVWRNIGPETVTEVSSRPISARQLIGLLRKYDVITINLATVCVFIVRQGVLNTLVPIFGRLNIGLTLGELGVVLSVGAVGNLATMLLAGTLTDRFGRKPFFLAGLGLAALFTALLPLTSSPLQLTGVIVGLSLALGLSGPAAAWLTDVVEPAELGGAMGLFRTIGDLGFVLAPVTLAAVAGTAEEVSGLPFFLAAAVVLLLTVPLMRTRDPVAEMRRTDLNV